VAWVGEVTEEKMTAKLLCKGTDLEVTRWMIENCPEKFPGNGLWSAVIETEDGCLQKCVWRTEQDMEDAVVGYGVRLSGVGVVATLP